MNELLTDKSVFMFDIIIGALLPIAVILLLGYFAGARRDFNQEQAGVFNEMVMLYALPLCLFSSIVMIPFDQIVEQKDLAVGLFFGMIALYFAVLLFIRYLLKQDIKKAAILTLAITCPSAAFIGMPVLGSLFGHSISTVSVAIVSIYMNLIQVPITIILLTTNQSGGASNKFSFLELAKSLLKAFEKPLVWAPVLALVFSILRIKFPAAAISAFDLLGKATGGVALFASGIILFSYKIKINKEVIFTVIARNLIIPILIWGIVYILKFPIEITRETVLTLAIPISSISIILAIQYKESEQTVATSLFVSTLFSLITMAMFITILPG